MSGQRNTKLYFPFIPGIEALFGVPLFSINAKDVPEAGFRSGGSIVIEGPPGSGKTAATLAICRSMMPDQTKRLYYLSTEVTKERLQKNHSGFGWFQNDDPIFTDNSVYFAEFPRARMDRPLPSSAELVNEIFRRLSAERRRPGTHVPSLVIVDSLSGLLRDASTAGERRRLTEDFLERLETEFGDDLALTFLITESTSSSENDTPLEQYVADYVIELGYKEVTGGRRIRTWDIVKSHGTYMVPGKHTWEFFTKATFRGVFVERSLQEYVTNFEGQRLSSSRAIAGGEDSEDFPTATPVSGDLNQSDSDAPNFATIIIYPQWTTYLPERSEVKMRSLQPASNFVWSGTPGLDEMLMGDAEYWSRPDKWSQTSKRASWKPGLRPGETTLLLGSSGTLKTWLSIQFLAGNLHKDARCNLHSNSEKFVRFDTKFNELAQPFRDRRRKLSKVVPETQSMQREKETLREKIREARNEAVWETFYRKTLFLSFEGESTAIIGLAQNSRDLSLLFRNFVYVSPASLHLNRLLFELLWICTNRRVERVAIDGLADLLKCVDAKSRIGITTALLRVVNNASSHARDSIGRPLVFITLELPPDNTPMVPDSEGISAICDNVLMLKQIQLNDQMHKAVYVLKAQSRRHDRQIREVIFNSRDTGETPAVRVQSGFEGFTGIISGEPKRAQVTLELFCENEAEASFNKRMERRLSATFAYHVKLHTFSHSEWSQFLDEAKGSLGQVPATDIKVISLDEWWLRDLHRGPHRPPSQELSFTSSPSPLLRVDGFFALAEADSSKVQLFPLQQRRSIAANQGLASEHWITEIEKGVKVTLLKPEYGNEFFDASENDAVAMATNSQAESSDVAAAVIDNNRRIIDAELQAMPHYSDFGLFCLNVQRARDLNLRTMPPATSVIGDMTWLPKVWAAPDAGSLDAPWFSPPRSPGLSAAKKTIAAHTFGTLSDVLHYATRHGKYPERGFTFDMSRGETAVCFFMELAWSFGVPEGFLSEATNKFVTDKGVISKENPGAEALRSAFTLLQYLVFHGLMPPFPTSTDCSESLFTRQWYSTLNIPSGVEHTSSQLEVQSNLLEVEDAEQQVLKKKDVTIAPIPFFPLGMLPSDNSEGVGRHVVNELVDIRRHVSGLLKRVEAALFWIHCYRVKISSAEESKVFPNNLLKQSAVEVRTLLDQIEQKMRPELAALKASLTAVNCSDHKMVATIVPDGVNILKKCVDDVLKMADAPQSGLAVRQMRWCEWEVEDADQGRRRKPWVAAGMAMDARDIHQMAKWINVRLDLVRNEMLAFGNGKRSALPMALQGFGCSGTWMLGVLRNTHSPGLSWKLIEEMTSPESTRIRAEMGAGIPTRKDFYDFHGDTPVPRIPKTEEIPWREFLTTAGAKVRRRDRAVCAKVPLAQFSALIRSQMIRCVNIAAAEREKSPSPAKSIGVRPSSEILKRLNAVADDAARQVLLFTSIEQNSRVTDQQSKNPVASRLETTVRCDSCPLEYEGISGSKCGMSILPVSK